MSLSGELRERGLTRVQGWAELEFLQGVGDGTLPIEVFRNYLEQDHLYLRAYARWYSRLAAHAPDEHVEHLVLLAANVVQVELDAHRRLAGSFGADLTAPTASESTRRYVEFLDRSTRQGFGAGLAAMLPCLWGYGVALTLVPKESSGPYRPWLDTYTSGAYQHVVDRHCAMLDTAELAPGTAHELFDRALDLEVEFFAQRPNLLPVS